MKQDRLPVFQRLAAGLLGIGVVIAIASGAHRAAQRQASQPKPASEAASNDPLHEELHRCSALTVEKAQADERCQRAWILNRQRFFGQHRELLEDLDPEEE